VKIIAANKKATYDYNISLKLDAGIVLTGSEVKSLRNISPSIKESYIEEKDAELWLNNCFIKKFASSSDKNNDPTRSRKLLVNRKELNKILGSIRRDGFSVVPITMFFSAKGFVKLNIGLGKGKKKYDKREDQKSKDWNRNKQRLLKNN
jgi:SsrA-binding protein